MECCTSSRSPKKSWQQQQQQTFLLYREALGEMMIIDFLEVKNTQLLFLMVVPVKSLKTCLVYNEIWCDTFYALIAPNFIPSKHTSSCFVVLGDQHLLFLNFNGF